MFADDDLFLHHDLPFLNALLLINPGLSEFGIRPNGQYDDDYKLDLLLHDYFNNITK